MRLIHLAALLACAAACHHDSDNPANPDATTDAPASADGIAAARAAADGTGLTLAIRSATVTYLKPLIGNPPNDPVGFTIQATKTGPGLFVAVDPATLTPPAAIGDVISFTITSKTTVSKQPRAVAITDYARVATGTDAGALAQDITSVGDLVGNIDHYDSELVTVSGSLDTVTAAGVGFSRTLIHTTGLASDPSYQLRLPALLVDAIDLDKTCKFTASRVPMGRFSDLAQIGVFAASDLALTGCPAPAIIGVSALAANKLVLTLSRHILPSSLKADGSQFTFSNGLTATSASMAGRTITLTTSAQSDTASYTATIAKTLTDLQGSSVSNTISFAGFGGQGSAGASLSVHTTLGIPGPISPDAPSDNFVSVKPQYVVSYNATHKIPNWVSWELNASYFGGTDRQDNYRPDDTFPVTEPQAALADYSGSGYDRGHMCPSADRTKDITANSATFYLTNMIPQAANNNQGPWANLEIYTRDLIGSSNKEIFIISGGIVTATSKTVGNGLYVPDSTFKVIVVLDAVGQGAAAVTTNTRVLSVIMPNDNALISKSADWHDYRVSVDTIEAQTGLDFLSDVDPAIQAVVEARVDTGP